MKNLKAITKFSWLLIIVMAFYGCKDDEEVTVGDPPVANAGADIDAFVGSTVTLNGSNSADPDGGALEYSWELTQSPSGSSATISNGNSASASFVPDVEGIYTATLTVEDEDENTDVDEVLITATVNENEAPTAVITDDSGQSIAPENNNNVINAGNMVQFFGGQSTDPENDDLSYEWSVTSAPSGSSPTLANENTATLDFTADAAGEYTIKLVVDDGNGNQNSAEVTIEAEVSPVIIDADINSDVTWDNIYDDPNLPDYRITTDIDVNALLTIAPGVKVEVEQGHELMVTSSGGFIADGTADLPIVLTTSNIDAGFNWKGLAIFSADQRNKLNHVTIAYGGDDAYIYVYNEINSYVPANLSLNDGSRVSILNSSFTNSYEAGILADEGAELLSFENNSISGNASYAMLLSPDMVSKVDNTTVISNNEIDGVAFFSGTLSSPYTWNELSANADIVGAGKLVVNSLLELNPGVSILMSPDKKITIDTEGGFISSGTEAKNVSISSFGVDSGLNWGGLIVESSDSRNSLDYTNISYGGSVDAGYVYSGVNAYVGANVYVSDNSKMAISNSVISNSDEYGLVTKPTGSVTLFDNNTISNNVSDAILTGAGNLYSFSDNSTFSNNGTNTVRIYSGAISTAGTINPLEENAVYYITGDLEIESNVIVEPGTVFELEEDVFIDIESTGSLKAIGTDANKIIFTTSDLAGGRQWGGIRFYSSSSLNQFEYVTVSYGGSDDAIYLYGGLNTYVQANIALDGGANLLLNNSTVTHSLGYGLVVGTDSKVNSLSTDDVNNISLIINANTEFSNNSVANIIFE